METIENSNKTDVWKLACSVNDIPEDGGACALIEGEQVAIFNFSRTEKWYATQNLCPHKQTMALSRGMIGDTNGEPKVACPFHKKTFSLESGTCLSGDEYSIKTYPIKIEGNKIYVSI